MSNGNANDKNEKGNAIGTDVSSNTGMNCFFDIGIDDNGNLSNDNKNYGGGIFPTGPFIPEIDCGYNIKTNGISINFLKNPFFFKNNFAFHKKHFYFKKDNDGTFPINQNLYMIKDNVKVLKPLIQTQIIEVPKYIYKENILHKTETVTKNFYVPHDAPIYVTREVKVPVYKEQIKYVPTIIEKERVYEIPKLEINELIQENLLFFHKNKIQYKKHNHIVERVIPKLNKRVIQKTVQVPSIINKEISDMTSPTTTASSSISKKFSSDILSISEDNFNQHYLEEKVKNVLTHNSPLYKNKKQAMTQCVDIQVSGSINEQLARQMSTLAEDHPDNTKMDDDDDEEEDKEKQEVESLKE